MKIKTPKQYCEQYLVTVYDGELNKQQNIEVTCAFYAGIEAACRFMTKDIFEGDEEDDEILAKRLVVFRKQNKDCAMHVNLLRFGE